MTAVSELHYTANAGARALATSKSFILALIVPFTVAEYAPATMQYVLVIAETARKFGYDILMVTEHEGAKGIERVSGSNLVDGLILLDVRRDDPRIASLERAHQPGVLIGSAPTHVDIDAVDLDFAAAGRLLVQHLAEASHTETVFLTLPDEIFEQDLRYAWDFRSAVIDTSRECGMKVHIVAGAVNPVARATSIASALSEFPEATALLVHNDGALTDLQHILEDRGIRVPDDLSVAGLFPEQFGRMFSLPYSAVDTAASQVAARAVELVIRRIETPTSNVLHELVSPTIIDRGTISSPALKRET